ncbi:MAG: hypothetical protein RR508_06670, partial [Oscillospiraceae bacterium]
LWLSAVLSAASYIVELLCSSICDHSSKLKLCGSTKFNLFEPRIFPFTLIIGKLKYNLNAKQTKNLR